MRRLSKQKHLCWIIVFLFALTMVPIFPAVAEAAPAKTAMVYKAGDQCTVTAYRLNMRSGAGTSMKVLQVLPRNTTVTVLKKQGSWYQVRLTNNKVGWVYGTYITPVKAAIPAAAVATPVPVKPDLKPASLTVSAAASLTDAMNEIKELYAKERKQITLTLNLGSSGSLQQQIENGAPVDVFISAAPKQMDALQKKKLIVDESRKDLLRNRIALITPRDSKTVQDFKDLTNPQIKVVAIGEPDSVPAGKYAKEVMTSLGIWDKVQPKLVFGKDVRQVLAYVESGNADAGFVFLTDAKISEKVRTVVISDEKSHSPVIYPVAIIKDSKNKEAAQDFIAFLNTDQGRTVFEKLGFKLVN